MTKTQKEKVENDNKVIIKLQFPYVVSGTV